MIEELRSRWRDLPLLKQINKYEGNKNVNFVS